MTFFKRVALFAVTVTLGATMTSVASADTADAPVIGQEIVLTRDAEGNPTSGMIEIDLSNTNIFTRSENTKYPNGGIWKYGTGINTLGNKTCYSNYYHGSVRHSATSKIGSITGRSVIKQGRTWANSSVTGGKGALAGTCEAYWRTY